jgi:hypothetical protein
VGGPSPLDEAARHVLERGAKDATAREKALAGFAAYLFASDVARATSLFAEAHAADPSDPWAIHGQAELARRSLDDRGRVLRSLAICAKAPRHLLCAVGARLLDDFTGRSPGLDRGIEDRAEAALSAGAEGDTAYLLRMAVARIRRNRGDEPAAQEAMSDAGAVSAAVLLGPYSRYHALEFDEAFPPEKGEIRGGDSGPLGAITLRDTRAPDGRYSLFAEPSSADVYYLATEVDVKEGGAFLARASSPSSSVKLFVDGALAAERRAFAAYSPREIVGEMELAPGKHRLLVKLSRGTDRGEISLALARSDGRPASLGFSPSRGVWAAPIPAVQRQTTAFPDARALAAALEPEVGATLAAFVAARDALERDDQGAKALLAELPAKARSAAFLVLRAEAGQADGAVPQRIRAGRAQRDLEDALKLDAQEASAWLRLSIVARSDGRLDEAAAALERARPAAHKGGWRTLLSEARLAQARGVDALADDAAKRALSVEKGLCEALVLRYDFARRLDAVAAADGFLAALEHCPGSHHRAAEHLRLRGDLAGARARLERQAAASPLDPGPRQQAAQVAIAMRDPKAASAQLASLVEAWPHSALYRKRRAEALEAQGDVPGARSEREAALRIDGSDLRLRRSLAVEDGTEILDALSHDGEAALESYLADAPRETSAGVYVLDAAAMEGHADGSITERTHVLAKVVDQRGVGKLAEVHLPAGAEVLTLRTRKRDGRSLEPENLADKDSVSLPGVEVGDFVEYEYLASTASRGPSLPGFAMPKFYFRMADGQIFRSVFEARAPKGHGLAVDAHGMEAPVVSEEGAYDRVTAERRNAEAFVPEPGQPSVDEILPFVQVGAGAGNDELLTSFGDMLIDRTRPTLEIERFAREAAAGKQGLEAVRAVYEKVMQEVKGKEGSLTGSAAATLAQGRGSRLLLLRAALDVLGVRSRLFLVRPFGADPAPYRFPVSELFSSPALEVEVAGQTLLLDPSVRFAPFGRLPVQAEGQDAAILPGVSERLSHFRTRSLSGDDIKKVSLTLTVSPDGVAAGEGEERYEGFEAAYLRSGLERLDEEQRKQAIEAAVSRTFRGASLTSFEVREEERSGTPVVLRYRFSTPGFARVDGNRLVLSHGIYPAGLSRRYVALFERATPLYLGSPERQDLSAEVRLPKGMGLVGPPQSVKLESPFGRFERTEKTAPGQIRITESLSLPMNRVPAARYGELVRFVSAVDKEQAREWVVAAAQGP